MRGDAALHTIAEAMLSTIALALALPLPQSPLADEVAAAEKSPPSTKVDYATEWYRRDGPHTRELLGSALISYHSKPSEPRKVRMRADPWTAITEDGEERTRTFEVWYDGQVSTLLHEGDSGSIERAQFTDGRDLRIGYMEELYPMALTLYGCRTLLRRPFSEFLSQDDCEITEQGPSVVVTGSLPTGQATITLEPIQDSLRIRKVTMRLNASGARREWQALEFSASNPLMPALVEHEKYDLEGRLDYSASVSLIDPCPKGLPSPPRPIPPGAHLSVHTLGQSFTVGLGPGSLTRAAQSLGLLDGTPISASRPASAPHDSSLLSVHPEVRCRNPAVTAGFLAMQLRGNAYTPDQVADAGEFGRLWSRSGSLQDVRKALALLGEPSRALKFSSIANLVGSLRPDHVAIVHHANDFLCVRTREDGSTTWLDSNARSIPSPRSDDSPVFALVLGASTAEEHPDRHAQPAVSPHEFRSGPGIVRNRLVIRLPEGTRLRRFATGQHVAVLRSGIRIPSRSSPYAVELIYDVEWAPEAGPVTGIRIETDVHGTPHTLEQVMVRVDG